jgi:hypothetical protein
MRIAGLLLLLGLGIPSCKSNGEAAADPNAAKAQQELIARRDALLKQRQQLQQDRDKIDAEIKDVQSKGGDATDLVKRRADIDTQLESQTSDLINTLSNKISAIQATGDRSAQIAAREAEIGSRERTVAEREAKLADRERALSTREAEAAQRWKDSCAVAAPVIIQGAGKSGTYTKKDVADLIGKAKATMAKKGVLTGDLPGPAQSLESEASKAMNDNDFSKAYFAAAQLAGQVDAIQINRAFIQAKTARLQAQVKSSRVDEATNQQLDATLRDVMVKYNDGDFGAANKRLNVLAGMLH